jgi:hypothetical protein
LAYTVEDAIAALLGFYADPNNNPNMFWWIQASITITDTPIYAHPPTEEEGAPFTGTGNLWVRWWEAIDTLTNLSERWDSDSMFKMRRGATGPSFLLGLAIEPVYTFVGGLSVRPPAFARSFVQRHNLVRPKQYRGVLALPLRPRFTVALTEDPINPKLTGTITPSWSVPGFIHPPAAIEVVLESIKSDVVQ